MINKEKLNKITQSKGRTLLTERFKKIEEKAKELKKGKIAHISIADLEANPFQPRLEIKEKELKELMNSIKENGLLQPILVAPQSNGKYYILAGHRRTEAVKRLGEQTIEAIIIKDKQEEKELASIAMIENIQRVQLNPIEEAILYQRMLDSGLFKSIREIGRKLGKDHGNISKKLSILKLDKKIINDIVKYNTTKDVTGLAMINAFAKNDAELQWVLYQILKNEGRESLKQKIKELKNSTKENHIKPLEIKKSKKSIQIKINGNFLNDEDLKFIEEIISKILKEKHKQ